MFSLTSTFAAGFRCAARLILATGLAAFVCSGAQAQTALSAPSGDESSREPVTLTGAADLRYRDTDRETRGSYVAATRLQADWQKRDPHSRTVQGGARAQFFLETDGRGTSVSHLRASEIYGYYDFLFPGVFARVKAGQFTLPFGLTGAYDPLQPIQPLYEKSLGLRVDTGIGLEGEYGPYQYSASLTHGTGPDRTAGGGKVVTFRLSRAVETDLGRFEVGGSLLSGRLPVTTFSTELPASGYNGSRQLIDKTRFAGDGQYFFGPVTLRGEVVFGGDGQDAVWGYFGEGNYRVLPRVTLVAVRSLWNFPAKPEAAGITGLGVDYQLRTGFVLRALYEYERDVPLPAGTDPKINRRLTLQTRLNF